MHIHIRSTCFLFDKRLTSFRSDSSFPFMAASEISEPSYPAATAPPGAASDQVDSACNISSAATAAYEHYVRLPELAELWSSKEFPGWSNESVLKPALQGLEITFRLISLVLSDPRPYACLREWRRRLESLAARQLELIAVLCEDEGPGGCAPIAVLGSCVGLLPRERSSHQVWKVPGAASVVCRSSEERLLPLLAAWDKSEDVAAAILFQIEGWMRRCSFTLGLGEPNLAGKPTLEFDCVVRPSELHTPKRRPGADNHEDAVLCPIHQILEAWLFAAGELLARIERRIDAAEWATAARDCWTLERAWKLLAEVEDLHMLMDPDDFIRLESQLGVSATTGAEAFCFRSAALLRVTSGCKELKRRVPWVLGVEPDPDGGPRVQDAAVKLFHSGWRGEGDNPGRVELLQVLQAVEAALRRFFFAYRLLAAAVMGSVEASSYRAVYVPTEELDPLSQLFLEPPYFPSLDAAKTFLGDFWQNEKSRRR